MTNKIRKSMLLLVLIGVVLFSLGTSFLFYDTERNQAVKMVKNQATLIQSNYMDIEEIQNLNAVITQSRITLIDESGTVVFDNKTALENLDNHNDRQEIIEARAYGFGEEERYSDSFLSTYYYYAIMLDNGLILRVSTSINSLLSLIYITLPFTLSALLVIVALANYISKKLAYNIIEPIEKADLKSTLTSPYVELDLYFHTMREQKDEIQRQMVRVNKRKETINTILNTMQEGFMIVDEKQNVFLANQAFLEIFDVKQYEVGDSIYRFINDRKLLRRIEKALDGESSNYKVEFSNKTYQVYISHTRILEENVAILLFVDISLEYVNQRHREQFSANVSHELKTPLTSIKGLAELQANDMVASEDVVEFGEKILKQSNRLLELIEHIMRLSEFDEDVIAAEKETVLIKPLTDTVLSHLSDKLIKKNIKLSVDVDEVSIEANYHMMDELIYNLLDNAIKYNYENGWIKLKIKDEDGLLLSVSNSGQKIPESELPHLFERFYRVDSSRYKKTGGTGLGLSIVKHIVIFHNGSVEVKSDDYTEFVVKIPHSHK